MIVFYCHYSLRVFLSYRKSMIQQRKIKSRSTWQNNLTPLSTSKLVNLLPESSMKTTREYHSRTLKNKQKNVMNDQKTKMNTMNDTSFSDISEINVSERSKISLITEQNSDLLLKSFEIDHSIEDSNVIPSTVNHDNHILHKTLSNNSLSMSRSKSERSMNIALSSSVSDQILKTLIDESYPSPPIPNFTIHPNITENFSNDSNKFPITNHTEQCSLDERNLKPLMKDLNV